MVGRVTIADEPMKEQLPLPDGYGALLGAIKERVRTAQIRAGLAANRELLALHWDIGRLVLDRQQAEGWGAKVIDRLSRDLQAAFPGQQGFSPRNLKYMRAFADAWPDPAFVQQPAAQIPWTHHCMLLDKVDNPADRLWYAAKAIEHGWSRNVLALQIGDQDFYLDLLFYHLTLRCFVVIDLKARDFTPEAAGKMNFYLSAVDDCYRHSTDAPSIGLNLCRTKNRVLAEYALRDLNKPIGVADFVNRLVETLPEPLQAAVPSVKEIEAGLLPLPGHPEEQ